MSVLQSLSGPPSVTVASGMAETWNAMGKLCKPLVVVDLLMGLTPVPHKQEISSVLTVLLEFCTIDVNWSLSNTISIYAIFQMYSI